MLVSGQFFIIIACLIHVVALSLLQYLGDMSKDRLVTFEGVIRFCSLVCEVMIYLLKSNSLTQDEVRSLPVIRKFGVSIAEVLLYSNMLSLIFMRVSHYAIYSRISNVIYVYSINS